MCLSKEKWQSRLTPRIFMLSDNKTEQPPTSTEQTEAKVLERWRLPSSIASDLPGFSVIPLRQNYDCKACRQVVRLAISDDGSDGFNAMKSWVSSAYCWWKTWKERVIVAIGEVYVANNNGPRTEPWGTPVVHLVRVEEWWPMRTDWVLLDR